MYQPYYILQGEKITKSHKKYNTLKEQDRLQEKFTQHTASMKQIMEAYNEFKNCY